LLSTHSLFFSVVLFVSITFIESIKMIVFHLLSFVLWACLGQATLTPRKPFDTAFYVFNGAWPCSEDQLKTISGAIDEAHDLAKAAINILSKPESEQSIAFESWFGTSMSPSYRNRTILTTA
jgi:hypothetical protein